MIQNKCLPLQIYVKKRCASSQKVWYPLDEIIYNVLGRMQSFLKECRVKKYIPQDVPHYFGRGLPFQQRISSCSTIEQAIFAKHVVSCCYIPS